MMICISSFGLFVTETLIIIYTNSKLEKTIIAFALLLPHRTVTY